MPSLQSTAVPSSQPKATPTTPPYTSIPSSTPSTTPSLQPSASPSTTQPSSTPSGVPTLQPLVFTTSVLVINSTFAEMNYDYARALATTLAVALSIRAQDVVVEQSVVQRRRLFELYAVIVEVVITIPIVSFLPEYMGNYTAMENYLHNNLTIYVDDGRATYKFRHELTVANVSFYQYISIGAVDYSPTPAPQATTLSDLEGTVHTCTHMYTPTYLYIPIYTTIHPYTSLYTPINPYTPLYTPITRSTPLYTPITRLTPL